MRAYRAVAKACAPKMWERIEAMAKALRTKAVRPYRMVAKSCAPKLCTVERIGQEAEAKIGVILALRR